MTHSELNTYYQVITVKFQGKSALHTAARTGNVEMIKLLLDNGADIKLLDSKVLPIKSV